MELEWLFELKKKIPLFLMKLKGNKVPGFFHYSLTGDLYDDIDQWGLGNTVFAAKIYYMLGILNDFDNSEIQIMANFIRSFQGGNGIIHDPLIKKKAVLLNILYAVKNLDFNNILGQQTMIAETRQSISSLILLGEKPDIPDKYLIRTEREIEEYLNSLNWEKPWGAGSHFSHLLFFLKNSALENKNNLIDFAINHVMKFQSEDNGSWYRGNPTIQQKINGAMKVITGLKVAEKVNFKYAEHLIDLCLSSINDKSACDNFNIVYVLKYANELTGFSYRYDGIKKFAKDRLSIYRKNYYPDAGGFSFKLKKANSYYYGARITRGLDEPDIHGTVMFLWGISIITQLLGIQDQTGFEEHIP